MQIISLLKRFYFLKRRLIYHKYKRVVPLNEMLTDRWEKAKFLRFGKESSIYDSSIVIGEVDVGENTWIGPFTILDGSGGLSIGSNCSISAGVQIYTHNSVDWAISGGKKEYRKAPTKIGNNCYIGPNSVIATGVILGDRCIVGANSLVNNSFSEDSKIAGNPARLIGNNE